MSAGQYPLPRPADDPRFTFGLIYEVGKVLAEHGYPKISDGADHVRLQQALFGFIYADSDDTAAVDRGRPHNEDVQ